MYLINVWFIPVPIIFFCLKLYTFLFWHFRSSSSKVDVVTTKIEEITSAAPATPNAPRNVKTKSPVIGESIKMVTNQLLENQSNTTVETPIVTDTRIPPKLKNQIHKHNIKTRNEDGEKPIENAHPGIAVPVTMEELEKENKLSESSTSNEGISTWILLSNPSGKDNVTSTEPTKAEEPPKKQKPASPTKTKTKRPQTNKVSSGKRPIIGSTNKSDLVAGGSAINENVYNKIKDTVLSNVQKNKNSSSYKTTVTTTTTTTTVPPSTEAVTTKKEPTTKAPSSVLQVKVTSKPSKKKNKNKHKSTTPAPIISDNESALLPMEPKEQEIELEINTPPTTTKKPKRVSTRKKNKTKKRKTSKPKPETSTAVSNVKASNKTKSTKTKKPSATSLTGPITSQIYNYFSREVMPTVGVGALGLATLVGLAGYFFYPFATPVRRTFEVDKKDDIYRHNAEEYANEGNGQAEEEMLGTVLAGMPAHSKQKLNPYAGQTAHVNRYPVKKEQDIRYRHVATKYEPNYNVRYPQQKTGIAHGAVYAEPVNYNPHQYETRHVYTTEGKYVYDKGPNDYTPSPVEPMYAAPQTGPSSISVYGSESSNSVVYGVKPTSDTDFKPVYPFEGQFYSETTSSPMTYPPTSMYLGSNNDANEQKYSEEQTYSDETNSGSDGVDNKFVVGNVPKELVDTATPAVVPEHGPRYLNRRKRNFSRRKRSISTSIEEILKEAKENNKDVFISNEIDEPLGLPIRNLAPLVESMPFVNDATAMPEMKDVFTVYGVSSDSKVDKTTEIPTTEKSEFIESVSTIPIDFSRQGKTTTESDTSNELETTTKPFRVYEVFTSSNPADTTDMSSPLLNPKAETTTQFKNMNTETTTELKSETTSTMPPSLPPVNVPLSSITTPKPTNNPEVLTYPPLNQDGGFFTFLKRLIEFKYRLGLSILQTTSDNLNRYLRSIENSASKVANASKT